MGSLTRVVAAARGPFEEALAAHAGKASTLLVLFTGEKDASGTSWCPDCNDAQPLIDAALKHATEADGANIVLITVPLPRAEYKGNPSHWAR